MLKKLVLFLAAVMLLASSVQAGVDDVGVFTTVPTLQRETCGQAGSLVLTFDQGTFLNNATDITGELPAGKICQDIDLFVNATASIVNGVAGPLRGNATIAGGDFLLRVTAKAGTNSLTMKVLGAANATAGAGGMKLQLFDGKKSTPGANKAELLVGNWNGTALLKATNETAEYNSLCVKSNPDVADGANLILSLDSTLAKYAYSPGNPAIAVIAGTSTVSVVKAKGNIPTFVVPTGEQKSCSFSYEKKAGCAGLGGVESRYFALKNGSDYPAGDYNVDMEILVNGASGNNGVYFEGASSGLQFTDDIKVLTGNFTANRLTVPAKTKYFLGDGSETTDTPVKGCERKDSEKIVRILTVVEGIDAAVKSQDYLRINVPSVAVTKAMAGDEIAIKVTVRQGRCGEIFSGTYPLFKMVEKCSSDAGEDAGNKLVFPYFADAPYWNGMALTNTGKADVNATLTIVSVDKAGVKSGEASLDVVVPANGMFVGLVKDIIGSSSSLNGTAKVKDRSYIIVEPKSGDLKGFAMMGYDGESMGYTVNN